VWQAGKIVAVGIRENDVRELGLTFRMEGVSMRNGLAKLFAVGAGLLLLAVPLFAHHGAAAFEPTKRITMKGTVVEWFWANPHCVLRFDVTNDKGEVEHWLAETSNPADMINYGWAKQSVKPGIKLASL